MYIVGEERKLTTDSYIFEAPIGVRKEAMVGPICA
jgi:hypothetical protein